MKLSVITINYNNCDGLRKTIESVINQTWHGFEYIIIDGGSTDGSVNIIKEFANRIDYWISEPDKGIYNAMNKGIDAAKGEYCIFINSGDCLYNNETLSKASVDLCDADVITGTLMLDNGELWTSPDVVTIPHMYEVSLCHPASFIKSSFLKKYHYDENLKIVSDWKFFIQVLIIDGALYKRLSYIISVFDTSGISQTNQDLVNDERISVLEKDFPKSIYSYYLDNTKDYDAKLYNIIRGSSGRRVFYTINVFLVKIWGFLNRKKWPSKFPLKLT